MKSNRHLLTRTAPVAFALAAAFWLADTAFHWLIFRDNSFFSALLAPDTNDFVERLTVAVFAFFLLFYAQLSQNRLRGAVHELAESQRFSESLLENAPNPVIVLNPDNSIRFVNRAFTALTGFSSAEVLGARPPFPYWCPTLQSQYARDFMDTNLTTRERQFQKKDGQLFWVELSAKPIKEKGLTRYHLINWIDIDQRKKTEAALIASQQYSASLLDHAPNPITVVNPDGSIRYVNPALEALTGYSSTEVIGRKTPYPWWPEETQMRLTSAEELNRLSNLNLLERNYRKKTGERFWVMVKVTTVTDNAGQVLFHLGNWMDITARKEMEEKLKESERFATSLLENSPNPVLVGTPESVITYVNPAFENLTGFSSAEAIGQKPPFPWSRSQKLEFFRDQRTGDETFNQELLQRKKSGENFWISANIRRIWDRGQPRYNLANWVDITQRKEAEQKLQEMHAFNLSILENSPIPIMIQNPDASIGYVNPALEKLTGFNSSELLNRKPPYPYWPEGSTDYWHEMQIGFKRGLGEHTVERLFRKKSGEPFWIELTNSPVRDSRGELQYFVSGWVDVTAGKRAQEAMRNSEEKYRSLVNNVKLGISRSTPGDPGKFLEVNKAMEDLTGYSRDELLNMSVVDLYLHPEERPAITGRAVSSPQTYAEVQFRKKDGTPIMMAVTIAPVKDRSGRFIYLDTFLEDISQRKKMEEERREIEQKAQIANRLATVGEMAAGIAHEINNPLTSVIGYADLLMRKDLDPEIKQTLGIIHQGSRRVADIVQRLMFFARQSKPFRDIVSINGLIENTLQLRAHQLKVGNIGVTLQLRPDLPEILADGGQLQQVFLNIIANAEIEMNLAHGKGNLRIETQLWDNTIRISFQDDGPGISPENMQKLFQPFFTTRAVGKGTGLGLSVCHGIINAHSGRIWAESQPGQGAAFFIDLPLLKSGELLQTSQEVIRNEHVPTKSRILVVDDEEIVRHFLKQALFSSGHQVDCADCAENAFEKIDRDNYDLILLDMKMPGMNGMQFFERLKVLRPALAARVIFITGDAWDPETENFLSGNKSPFVTKPLDLKLLSREMGTLLNEK